MYKIPQITDDIYYVGVNDRTKSKFEGIWPLPYGVAYNSYLIIDEKIVLVDTVDICYSDTFLNKLDRVLQGRKIDYLIINHMEPDHSGSLRILKECYPDIQLVGNRNTFNMVKGFYGITDNLHEVKEGTKLNIGSRELEFYMAPMVHWPEVMFTYDPKHSLLFSADAFGTYGTLDGGIIDKDLNTDIYFSEIYRYYSNIIGKYGIPVQKVLKKFINKELKIICSTHGPVWMENIDKVIDIYDKLSRYESEKGCTIVYGTMYGNTELMAETIANSLADSGIKNVVLHNVNETHSSYVLRDIFKYRGVIIGAPTYCNTILPEIKSILDSLYIREIKNRDFAYFGSCTWSGQAVKHLTAFAEKMKWNVVSDSIEQKMSITSENMDAAWILGQKMAISLNG